MLQKLEKRNYIRTHGCSFSLWLCGPLLKVLMGRDGVAGLKTFSNDSEEDLLQPAGGFKSVYVGICKRQEGLPYIPIVETRGITAMHDKQYNHTATLFY